MAVSSGGYPLQVTRLSGYLRAGVPPIASRISLANGQLPTDSLDAGCSLTKGRAGLRAQRRRRRRDPRFLTKGLLG